MVFSQAEQIKKENIDVIASRCTPASKNWVEDGVPRSMVIYDANPNRLDHWIEQGVKDGLAKVDFDFPDHPGYFDEEGEPTDLYQQVYSDCRGLKACGGNGYLKANPLTPKVLSLTSNLAIF